MVSARKAVQWLRPSSQVVCHTAGARTVAPLSGVCTHTFRDPPGRILHFPKPHAAVGFSDYPLVLPKLMSPVNTWTAWCCDTYQLVFRRCLAAWIFPILWNRWQCFCRLWNLYANNQHLYLSLSHKQNWRSLYIYRWDIKTIHLPTHQGPK